MRRKFYWLCCLLFYISLLPIHSQSNTNTGNFSIDGNLTQQNNVRQVVTYRYWIDNDLKDMHVNSYNSGLVDLDINVSTLSAGLHSISYQVLDNYGISSPTYCNYFVINKEQQATPIIAYEYWIDNEAPLRIEVEKTQFLDLSNVEAQVEYLNAGIHNFFLHVQTEDGRWSPTISYEFKFAIADILPWGTEEPWNMKYLFTQGLDSYTEPATDTNGHSWTEFDYDDSAWQTLTGPMANSSDRFTQVNYIWEGDDNCFNLRRTFTMDSIPEGKYQLLMAHDDGVRVYLNGQEVVNDASYGMSYTYDIPRSAFVVGENILAIYVEEKSGSQYLDYCLRYTETTKVQKIVLNETNIELEGGKRFTLQATVLPEDVEDKTVTWTVDDDSIATVSKSGVVRGWKKGTTTVTVASVANPNIKATCTVTVTSDYEKPNGQLPDVPFEFFYNAANYDETTHSIPNHPDANLAEYEMQLTADLPEFDGERLTMNGNTQGYITKWSHGATESGAYFFRQGQDNMTIIAKVKTKQDAESCDFISNRGGGYNYMFRVGNRNRFYLHTADAYDDNRSMVLPSDGEQIIAVRANGAENYIQLDNLTTGETLRYDGVNWGGGNNVFNFFNNCGSEYYHGDFYWAYYSFELLQDDELEAVAAAADGPLPTEYTDNQGLVYRLDREANTATVIGHTNTVSANLAIPENISRCKVTAFADGALADVDTIRSVTMTLVQPYAIPDNAFSTTVYEQATLYVPYAAIDTYRGTEGWQKFLNITSKYIPADLSEDTYFYIRNVNTNQFITASNAHGTQISVTKSGIDDPDTPPLVVHFIKATETLGNKELTGYKILLHGTYTDRSITDTYLFRENTDEGFIDWGGQDHGFVWNITKVGNYYRFQTCADDPYFPDAANQYMGSKESWGTRVVMSLSADDPDAYIDWELIKAGEVEYAISLSKDSIEMAGGEFERLTVSVSPKEFADRIVWSVADPTIAKVNNNGVVTGLMAGTTTITAALKDNADMKAECVIQVTSNFNLLVPWGTDEPWEAKYLYWDNTDIYQDPANDANGLSWIEMDYDDSRWQSLTGPMANNMERVNYKYQWTQDHSCFTLRRVIHLDKSPTGYVHFCMKHDDDTKVYMNGQLMIDAPDYTYDEIAHYKLPASALHEGDNMLAIYIQDTYGGWKFLDYAIGYSEPSVEATFDGSVLTVGGSTTMTDALESVGGRSKVAESIAAIVWNSTEASTRSDIEGFGNPNLLIYVQTESLAPEGVNNVVVDGKAKNIVLVDAEGNNNFYAPQEFTAESISYTREFKQTTQKDVSRGWEGICLPFTVQTYTHESHGAIAPFRNNASDYHFWLRQMTDKGLTTAENIEANMPYIISMPNSDAYPEAYNQAGKVTFAAENAKISKSTAVGIQLADRPITVSGTYHSIATGYYALNVGHEYEGNPEGSIFILNYREIRPFEIFTWHNGSGARSISLSSLFGGEGTTDIIDVIAEPNGDRWYDMNGRRLQSKPVRKGVYIKNGKKIVVK